MWVVAALYDNVISALGGRDAARTTGPHAEQHGDHILC